MLKIYFIVAFIVFALLTTILLIVANIDKTQFSFKLKEYFGGNLVLVLVASLVSSVLWPVFLIALIIAFLKE